MKLLLVPRRRVLAVGPPWRRPLQALESDSGPSPPPPSPPSSARSSLPPLVHGRGRRCPARRRRRCVRGGNGRGSSSWESGWGCPAPSWSAATSSTGAPCRGRRAPPSLRRASPSPSAPCLTSGPPPAWRRASSTCSCSPSSSASFVPLSERLLPCLGFFLLKLWIEKLVLFFFHFWVCVAGWFGAGEEVGGGSLWSGL